MNNLSTSFLSVEKIVHGGYGLSRNNKGEIVLLEGVLPGEEIVAVVKEKNQGVLRGEIFEIKKASEKRRTPSCKHYSECGGCDWLFIDYNTQVELKREIFFEDMKRIGKIENIPEPFVFKSSEFGYRRRAQLKINSDKKVGFYRKGTNIVVPLSKCPLLCLQLNELVSYLTSTSKVIPDSLTNFKVIVTDSNIVSAPILGGVTNESGLIYCDRFKFCVYGDDFFQNNIFLISQLGTFVASLCGEGNILIDLYGGIGFFSVFVAEQFKKVYLVEISGEMTKRAEKNFILNKVDNVESISSPAESIAKLFSLKPNVIILDPPRPGLTRKVREDIAYSLCPKKIVYVSCNSSTQARDVGFFVKKGDYYISNTAIFDLYPNTSHIESIVVLERE